MQKGDDTMDHDIKDLIILGCGVALSAIGAIQFNSIEVLMAGVTGAFAFLGVKSRVEVSQPVEEKIVVSSDEDT